MPGRDVAEWISVGEAARRCETTVRTLQYYDRIELLVAERDKSGRRRYGPEQLDRLRRIQLLTSAGLRLDEVGAALDRQAGLPMIETYSEQVRLLEIAELRLRCQRIVLAAVTQILREHPEARVPAGIVAAAMSLDRTLLRHPGVVNAGAGAPAGFDIDVERVITTYFNWKAHAVQALLLVENEVAADSHSGRRLGREWQATAAYALQDQPAGTGELYRATERSEQALATGRPCPASENEGFPGPMSTRRAAAVTTGAPDGRNEDEPGRGAEPAGATRDDAVRRRGRPRAKLRRVLPVVAAGVVGAVLAWLVLRDAAPVGRFDSAAAKDRYLAAYDEAMREMPEPDRVLDVRTGYGIVRVYRYAGAPGNNDREPFLLLPGTRSGAPVFADNMPGLLAQRSVYALDLLGEPGMSVQDRPIETHADQARWLHEVLLELPEPAFHLLGLSIGGWTAVNLAIHEPEKVASLILVEPVQTFAGLSTELLVRSLTASVSWFPKSWRDSFNSWTAGGAPIEDVPVARMIEAGMSSYTIGQPRPGLIAPERLRALELPVLAIIAGSSPMHDSNAAARCARENLRHGTVKIYPGASHAINGEQPQRIATDIADFLAGWAVPRGGG